MSRRIRLLLLLVVGVVALSAAPEAAAQGRNTINGRVVGPNGRAVSDAYVELVDEVGSTVNRAKVETSGRFTFSGLPDGRFKIKVMPYTGEYLEQVQEVVLFSVSGVSGNSVGGSSGSDNQHIEIVLRANERANASPFAASAPAVVFAQDVPPEAKRHYEQGIGFLREKKEKEGFESLRRSLELFPTYFLALDRLGGEYAVRGNQDRRYFEAARVLLLKAVEVNPKAFSSRFGLGFAQYHLGQYDAALESLQQAVNTYGKSPNSYLWLGIAQKRAGKLAEAEASLKRANELSKGKEADVHWQLASVYSEQKRYAEAAAELEQFLKARPDSRDAGKIKEMIAQLKEKSASK